MNSKNIIITGPTSGIGSETAKVLAQNGHQVFLLARNEHKAQRVISEIVDNSTAAKVRYIHCDLADMKTVKAAAETLKNEIDHIDVMINNAGGVFPQREDTVDRVEMTISVNHLGHFLLFKELAPLLQKARARIINVSSMAHFGANLKWDNPEMKKGYNAWIMYSNVKLFNIWFARGIMKRYASDGITAFSLHPGLVNTKFGHEYKGVMKGIIKLAQPFMISAAKGAETSIYLATADGVEQYSGLYFKKKKPSRMSRVSKSEKLSDKLWAWSEERLKQINY